MAKVEKNLKKKKDTKKKDISKKSKKTKKVSKNKKQVKKTTSNKVQVEIQENDSRRIFYETLLKEKPDSKFA